MVDGAFLRQSYEAYAEIEDSFNEALDVSLKPRGPNVLFDLVAGLSLPRGADAVDVGCGEGRHAIELARRFGLRVTGIDPVERHVEIASRRLSEAVQADVTIADRVRFEVGSAESIPLSAGSVDLVWCRDVLVHVDDLGAAYADFSRVLNPRGYVVVYQMFATDRLEPREAEWLVPTMGCIAENMRPEVTEAAITAAGFQVEKRLDLGSEWGEHRQEQDGFGGKKLLRAARLIRDPDRYLQMFGSENYRIALGDALWHVYRLLGKLSDRVYVLRPA